MKQKKQKKKSPTPPPPPIINVVYKCGCFGRKGLWEGMHQCKKNSE